MLIAGNGMAALAGYGSRETNRQTECILQHFADRKGIVETKTGIRIWVTAGFPSRMSRKKRIKFMIRLHDCCRISVIYSL